MWDSDSDRSKLGDFTKGKSDGNKEINLPIIKREIEIDEKYHVSQSEVALAWILSKKMVASVILGATNIHHIDRAAKAFNLRLRDEDINYLEESYLPHNVVGALYK